MVRIQKYAYYSMLLALLLLALSHSQNRFADYYVYEKASEQLVEHGSTVYDLERKTPGGFYYSVVFAFAFMPFAILGELGKILYAILMWLAYLKIINFSFSMSEKHQYWHKILAVLLSLYAVNDAFINANIGIFILALSIIAYEFKERSPLLAGSLIGLVVAFKFYPVIILGYFIWNKNVKLSLYAIGFALLFLFLPVFIFGFDEGFLAIKNQFVVLGNFESHWTDGYKSIVFQSLTATILRTSSYLGLELSPFYVLITLAGCVVACYLPLIKRHDLEAKMFVITLALTAMITPVSWYNMSLFYLPMIAHLVVNRTYVFLAVYAVLFCLTTPDIVGNTTNDFLETCSIPFMGLLSVFAGYVQTTIKWEEK